MLFLALGCMDICLVLCKICHEQKTPITKEEQFELLQNALLQCVKTTHQGIEENGTFCEQVWDGIMCWPPTQAGTTMKQKCPNYIHKFSENGYATRECMENGEWYINSLKNKTWSNYSGCIGGAADERIVPDLILDHLPRIQTFYNVGYGISMASLIIAVVMMVGFRKLHCQRNTVHINMFISFIMRSIICIVKDVDITPEVYNTHATEGSKAFGEAWKCKLVYVIFYYVLTANFMWIFVEGLFLHTFVMSTKYNISKKIYRTFLILGWTVPIFSIVPWIIVRLKYENTLCWNTMDNHYFWIIKGPIMVTTIINLIFFINIIRVLYTKLNASNTKDPQKFRKLARSTLVLIPLFGVYYIVFIAVPICMDLEIEVIWMYSETFFNSFQGFAVALLFCFLNEEVRREVLKYWRRRRYSRRQSNISGRSRTTRLSLDNSPHARLSETWDNNANFELKKSRNHVCNGKHDLNTHDEQTLMLR